MASNTPPTEPEVLRRLACLTIVVRHALRLPLPEVTASALGQMAGAARDDLRHQLAAKRDLLLDGLREARLWEAMTPTERTLMETLPLDIEHQAVVNACWRMESAAVLMWALGLRAEFPPFDRMSDPAWLEDAATPEPSRVHLRPLADLEDMRDLAELWHWRSRTRQLAESGYQLPSEVPFASLDEVVRTAARQAAETESLPVIDEDFAVRGKAYRDLSTMEWREIASIAMERHFSLNWLCGHAPGNRWDETPTET